MEEVPYRNTKLTVQTIPKDTLLFRIVSNPIDDFRGVLLEDGTRCLTPNYNVFFHPNPFMGSLALKTYLQKDQTIIYAYKLKKDVKVILLTNPSKYTRRTKNSKSMFVKRCSTVKKGCLPNEGKWYDPCLSDTIIKKYPNIVGILALSIGDTVQMKRNLKKTQKLIKYFKYTKDARGISGVPELILHPLTTRPDKDVISKDEDILNNNYQQLTKFNRSDIKSMETFMVKHAVFDPNTFFYTYTA
jgi:hypothetical protein